MKAPEMLEEAAEVFRQRNALYGDNYKKFGEVMKALLPGQHLALRTPDDYNRMGLLVQIVSKLGRYCENFEGGGHDDSLLDLAVYSQMLREIDQGRAANQPDQFA